MNRDVDSAYRGDPRPTTWADLELELSREPIVIDFFGVANAVRRAEDDAYPSDKLVKLLSENFLKIVEIAPHQKNRATFGQWINILNKLDSNNPAQWENIKDLLKHTARLIMPPDPGSDHSKPEIVLTAVETSRALKYLQNFTNMDGTTNHEPGLIHLYKALAWQAEQVDMDSEQIGNSLSGAQYMRNTPRDLEPKLKKFLEVFKEKINGQTEGLRERDIGHAFIGLQNMDPTNNFNEVLAGTITALTIHIEKAIARRDCMKFQSILMVLTGIKHLLHGELRNNVITALTKHLKAIPEAKTDKDWKKHLVEGYEKKNKYMTCNTVLAGAIEQLRGKLDGDLTYGLVTELFKKIGRRNPPTQEALNASGFDNLIYEILAPDISRNARFNATDVDLHAKSHFVAGIFGYQALQRYMDDDQQRHQMRLVPGRMTHQRRNRQTTWDVVKDLQAQFSEELIWEDPHSEKVRDAGAVILKKYLKPAPEFSGLLKDEQKSIDRSVAKKLEFSFEERSVLKFQNLNDDYFLSDSGLWNSMKSMIAKNTELGNPTTKLPHHEWHGEGEFDHQGSRYKAVYEGNGQKIEKLKLMYLGQVEAGTPPPAPGMQEGKLVLRI